MSTRSCRSALMLVACLLLVASPGPGPAAGQDLGVRLYLPLMSRPLPAHELVAMVRSNNQYDLTILNTYGQQVRRLTATPGDEFSPAWSPDGRLIVYVYHNWQDPSTNYHLSVVRPDGSGVARLLSLPWVGPPAWSPDGSRIAFVGISERSEGGAPLPNDLYIVNRDGSNLRRVTNTPGVAELQLAWSPDGRRLAFVGVAGVDLAVMVVNADGTGMRRFSDLFAYLPAWSPDGAWIAYIGEESDGRGQRSRSVYAQPTDGGAQRPLATCAESCYWPTWSPDGSRVAFTDSFTTPDGFGGIALAVVRADGQGQKQILYDRAPVRSPSWAPDGRGLAVEALIGSSPELLLVHADGSGAVALGHAEGISWAP